MSNNLKIGDKIMKKTIVSTKRLMILAVMMVMTISANAMNYNAAKNEALFVSYKGGHNKVHGSHYAHMHKPAVHHHAPAVHHPAPAPHHPKAPVKVDKRHGISNHTLASNTPRHGHSNAGHFGHR